MRPPVELGALTAGERDAVRLVYFEHFTLEQAARALGTDPVGLGRWLSRAYVAVTAQLMAAPPVPVPASGVAAPVVGPARTGRSARRGAHRRSA